MQYQQSIKVERFIYLTAWQYFWAEEIQPPYLILSQNTDHTWPRRKTVRLHVPRGSFRRQMDPFNSTSHNCFHDWRRSLPRYFLFTFWVSSPSCTFSIFLTLSTLKWCNLADKDARASAAKSWKNNKASTCATRSILNSVYGICSAVVFEKVTLISQLPTDLDVKEL